MRLARALLAVALASAAAPRAAEAKGKKKVPAVRAEDDPKLGGDAKAFAKATVAITAPLDGEAIVDRAVAVQLAVEGYALGSLNPDDPAAPFAILIVDNDVELRVDDASAPLQLEGLSKGPHLLRAVLSRPWGEVVKAKGAFAMVRFWVGARPAEKIAKRAEDKIWPDAKHPVLTYVFPVGETKKGVALKAMPAAQVGEGGSASASASASARPIPETRKLDFYLSGARLKDQGGQDKVRVVIDKKELPLMRDDAPLELPLKPGRNLITIDLLDQLSTTVKNAVNRTDRVVVVPDIAAQVLP